jgi:glucose/arabinose dehydrogenase
MRTRVLAVFAAILSMVLAGMIGVAGPASAATVKSTPSMTGLRNASALTVAPNGRVFVAEQGTGVIRVLNPATGVASEFYRVPGNRQIVGLAAHWAFPSTPYIYGFGLRLDASNRVRLQLFRITVSGGKGVGTPTVLRDFGAQPADHYGGRMVFGPDHLLYLSVGDGAVPADAQSPTSARGKILRMTATAGVPSGNPSGNRLWASGTRNVFGLAFDPGSSRLWATDNGPECNDELDLIAPGANYGWGPRGACTSPPTVASTNRDGPSPVLPKRNYGASTAPTGVAFCRSCGLGSAVEGNLVYGTYVTKQLRRVTLNAARTGVSSEAVLLQHTAGIVAVERAPNGVLWFIDRSSLRRVVLQ